MPRKWHPTDREDFARRYLDGESVLSLSESYGVSRPAITRRLIEYGVTLRSRSETERIKWSRMSQAERDAQVAAAHDATRGKPLSLDHRIAIAASREKNGVGIHPNESRLGALLAELGLDTRPQQAIGPYNCDLGAEPVAVEVFGGNWHWHERHLARMPKRINYLGDRGWHVLMCHVWPEAGFVVDENLAKQVVAFVKRARRNPTARREYRVIRSQGEIVSSGYCDENEIILEWATRIARDRRSGRYKSVPR